MKKNIDTTNFVASMAKKVANELEKDSEYTLAHDIIRKLKTTKQTQKTKTN